MEKKIFLRRLKKALRRLKPDEREGYISYYDEIISDLMENGVEESAACEQQGVIEEIAANIYEDAKEEMFKKKDLPGIILQILSIVLAVVSIICMFKIPKTGAFSVVDGDGPTAVFVAGRIKEPVVLYIVTAVVILIHLLYSWIRKRKTGIIVGIIVLAVFAGVWLIHGMGDGEQNTENIQNTGDDIDDEASDADILEERTKEIICLIENRDYNTLADTYATEEMKQYLTDEYMDSARNAISEDWGEYQFMGTIYIQEIRENGVDYTVAQAVATYENVSVTYTITYDSELRLAGLFMK